MNRLELNEHQLNLVKKISLCILKDIDRICRKNHIEYSLAYGTLIGGIRHHGFIPWDDDVDLMMLREDYDRFLEIAPRELDNRYYLVTHDIYDGYGLFFAKVMARNTLMKELTNINVDAPSGIFVDVFPMDNIPNDSIEQRKIYNKLRNLKRISAFKLRYDHGQTGLHRKVFYLRRFMYKLYPIRFVRKKYVELSRKYQTSTEVKEVCNYSGVYGFQKDTYLKEWFKSYEDVLFENITVRIVSEYDKWLRKCYGDYMKLPSEDKQVPHHLVYQFSAENFDLSD